MVGQDGRAAQRGTPDPENPFSIYYRRQQENLMTPLRKRMLEELKRRNYAPATCRSYVDQINSLAKHFGKSPDKLTAEELRQYQLHLIERKVSWSTFNVAVCAMRFFYDKVLERSEKVEQLPYGKTPKKLPVVLSREEVRRLWQAASTSRPWQEMAIKTGYACALRVSELVRVQVDEIDGRRHLLHVRGAKGQKDRYVPLSPTLLEQMRSFWKGHRNRRWLFPGKRPERHIDARTVQHRIPRLARVAGIGKRVTTHTLRHTAATHWLEAGVDLRTIQLFLGHTNLNTTAIYMHVKDPTTHPMLGALDLLAEQGKPDRSEKEDVLQRFDKLFASLSPEIRRTLFGGDADDERRLPGDGGQSDGATDGAREDPPPQE
jgi:integrase/recombinase XerD